MSPAAKQRVAKQQGAGFGHGAGDEGDRPPPHPPPPNNPNQTDDVMSILRYIAS